MDVRRSAWAEAHPTILIMGKMAMPPQFLRCCVAAVNSIEDPMFPRGARGFYGIRLHRGIERLR